MILFLIRVKTLLHSFFRVKFVPITLPNLTFDLVGYIPAKPKNTFGCALWTVLGLTTLRTNDSHNWCFFRLQFVDFFYSDCGNVNPREEVKDTFDLSYKLPRF